MRSLSGKKYPDAVADKIIVHPDVRKMLLTIKSLTEGGRAMVYEAALNADGMLSEDEKARDLCEDELGLHTPTLKAFLTERGVDMASMGMSVFGGAGFIKDYGMEQILRDAKISTLYEGTTGVQALDLIGRKIILNKGVQLRQRVKQQVSDSWSIGTGNTKLAKHAWTIAKMSGQELVYMAKILAGASKNRDIVGSASTDFLMYCGYVGCGYQWLKMMDVAQKALDRNPNMATADREFYEAKLQTGDFYMERVLPMALAHGNMCVKDPSSMMAMGLSGWDLATTLPSNSGEAYGKDYKEE